MQKPLLCLISLVMILWQPLSAQSLQQLNADMQEVAERVLPTVVSISSEKQSQNGGGLGLPFNSTPRSARALGSGVIIDKRGYIVTNYHVIKEASEITIALSDNREFSAEVVGKDPATDIAVIQITGTVPSDLPVITIADSSRIRPGQIAIAVGNAFGFSNTITMGIVSAINRDNLGLLDYEGLIQTDAAINPGNSGGALVDIDGKLIGINTAIYSRSGGSDGLGFAIPANQVQKITGELIKNGRIVRGWIGLLIQDITADIAENKGLATRKGILVTDVESGSPAKKAGLKENDIIMTINKQRVDTVNSLRHEVADMKPGAKVRFGIIRDGAEKTVTVVVGKMPERKLSSRKTEEGDAFGLVITDINETSSYYYDVTDRNGVIVRHVVQDSIAARAGIAAGDLIKALDGEPVYNGMDYQNMLDRYASHQRVQVLIRRNRQTRILTISR